jgi:hypothetical protein
MTNEMHPTISVEVFEMLTTISQPALGSSTPQIKSPGVQFKVKTDAGIKKPKCHSVNSLIN